MRYIHNSHEYRTCNLMENILLFYLNWFLTPTPLNAFDMWWFLNVISFEWTGSFENFPEFLDGFYFVFWIHFMLFGFSFHTHMLTCCWFSRCVRRRASMHWRVSMNAFRWAFSRGQCVKTPAKFVHINAITVLPIYVHFSIHIVNNTWRAFKFCWNM